MPPEFIVPGEQGVPFGSGFQIGPQATEGAPTCPPLPFRQRSNVPEGGPVSVRSANSSEQATSSFIVGTKGIVAYTAFVEEGDQMVLLEVRPLCPSHLG